MEQMITEFAGYGAIGVMAMCLFIMVLKERDEDRKINQAIQKEDRELLRKSVETFSETSKLHSEALNNLNVRVENLEEVAERTENKMDKVLDKFEAIN